MTSTRHARPFRARRGRYGASRWIGGGRVRLAGVPIPCRRGPGGTRLGRCARGDAQLCRDAAHVVLDVRLLMNSSWAISAFGIPSASSSSTWCSRAVRESLERGAGRPGCPSPPQQLRRGVASERASSRSRSRHGAAGLHHGGTRIVRQGPGPRRRALRAASRGSLAASSFGGVIQVPLGCGPEDGSQVPGTALPLQLCSRSACWIFVVAARGRPLRR